MFYGNVNSKENPAVYPQAIQKALKFLKETDLEALAPGEYPIDGDNIYAKVMVTKTAPRSTKKPEMHKEYIDVQYMIRGEEKDCFYPDMGGNIIAEDHYADGDYALYENRSDANEAYVVLKPGCFAVFFPADLHIPACSVTQDQEVKKVVVKVRMSEAVK